MYTYIYVYISLINTNSGGTPTINQRGIISPGSTMGMRVVMAMCQQSNDIKRGTWG